MANEIISESEYLQNQNILRNKHIIVDCFREIKWGELVPLVKNEKLIDILRFDLLILICAAKRRKNKKILAILEEHNLILNCFRPITMDWLKDEEAQGGAK